MEEMKEFFKTEGSSKILKDPQVCKTTLSVERSGWLGIRVLALLTIMIGFYLGTDSYPIICTNHLFLLVLCLVIWWPDAFDQGRGDCYRNSIISTSSEPIFQANLHIMHIIPHGCHLQYGVFGWSKAHSRYRGEMDYQYQYMLVYQCFVVMNTMKGFTKSPTLCFKAWI